MKFAASFLGLFAAVVSTTVSAQDTCGTTHVPKRPGAKICQSATEDRCCRTGAAGSPTENCCQCPTPGARCTIETASCCTPDRPACYTSGLVPNAANTACVAPPADAPKVHPRLTCAEGWEGTAAGAEYKVGNITPQPYYAGSANKFMISIYRDEGRPKGSTAAPGPDTALTLVAKTNIAQPMTVTNLREGFEYRFFAVTEGQDGAKAPTSEPSEFCKTKGAAPSPAPEPSAKPDPTVSPTADPTVRPPTPTQFVSSRECLSDGTCVTWTLDGEYSEFAVKFGPTVPGWFAIGPGPGMVGAEAMVTFKPAQADGRIQQCRKPTGRTSDAVNIVTDYLETPKAGNVPDADVVFRRKNKIAGVVDVLPRDKVAGDPVPFIYAIGATAPTTAQGELEKHTSAGVVDIKYPGVAPAPTDGIKVNAPKCRPIDGETIEISWGLPTFATGTEPRAPKSYTIERLSGDGQTWLDVGTVLPGAAGPDSINSDEKRRFLVRVDPGEMPPTFRVIGVFASSAGDKRVVSAPSVPCIPSATPPADNLGPLRFVALITKPGTGTDVATTTGAAVFEIRMDRSVHYEIIHSVVRVQSITVAFGNEAQHRVTVGSLDTARKVFSGDFPATEAQLRVLLVGNARITIVDTSNVQHSARLVINKRVASGIAMGADGGYAAVVLVAGETVDPEKQDPGVPVELPAVAGGGTATGGGGTAPGGDGQGTKSPEPSPTRSPEPSPNAPRVVTARSSSHLSALQISGSIDAIPSESDVVLRYFAFFSLSGTGSGSADLTVRAPGFAGSDPGTIVDAPGASNPVTGRVLTTRVRVAELLASGWEFTVSSTTKRIEGKVTPTVKINIGGGPNDAGVPTGIPLPSPTPFVKPTAPPHGGKVPPAVPGKFLIADVAQQVIMQKTDGTQELLPGPIMRIAFDKFNKKFAMLSTEMTVVQDFFARISFTVAQDKCDCARIPIAEKMPELEVPAFAMYDGTDVVNGVDVDRFKAELYGIKLTWYVRQGASSTQFPIVRFKSTIDLNAMPGTGGGVVPGSGGTGAGSDLPIPGDGTGGGGSDGGAGGIPVPGDGGAGGGGGAVEPPIVTAMRKMFHARQDIPTGPSPPVGPPGPIGPPDPTEPTSNPAIPTGDPTAPTSNPAIPTGDPAVPTGAPSIPGGIGGMPVGMVLDFKGSMTPLNDPAVFSPPDACTECAKKFPTGGDGVVPLRPTETGVKPENVPGNAGLVGSCPNGAPKGCQCTDPSKLLFCTGAYVPSYPIPAGIDAVALDKDVRIAYDNMLFTLQVTGELPAKCRAAIRAQLCSQFMPRCVGEGVQLKTCRSQCPSCACPDIAGAVLDAQCAADLPVGQCTETGAGFCNLSEEFGPPRRWLKLQRKEIDWSTLTGDVVDFDLRDASELADDVLVRIRVAKDAFDAGVKLVAESLTDDELAKLPLPEEFKDLKLDEFVQSPVIKLRASNGEQPKKSVAVRFNVRAEVKANLADYCLGAISEGKTAWKCVSAITVSADDAAMVEGETPHFSSFAVVRGTSRDKITTESTSSSNKSKGGAIAGAVIGSLAAIGVVGAAAFFVMKKKSAGGAASSAPKQAVPDEPSRV